MAFPVLESFRQRFALNLTIEKLEFLSFVKKKKINKELPGEKVLRKENVPLMSSLNCKWMNMPQNDG